MQLYAFPGSFNSRKVVALVNHLDLPVEIVSLTLEEVWSDDFAATNPNRVAPALIDGDLRLWESNAIGIHLARGTAMLPSAGREQSDMLRWLFWEGIHLNRALGVVFVQAVVLPQFGMPMGHPAVLEEALGQADKHLRVLDQHLADRRYMLGEQLTFVDLAVASAEPFRPRLPVDFNAFPNVQRHFDAVAELPAWQNT